MDERLEQIKQDYTSGKLLTGYLKAELIAVSHIPAAVLLIFGFSLCCSSQVLDSHLFASTTSATSLNWFFASACKTSEQLLASSHDGQDHAQCPEFSLLRQSS